MHLAWSQNGKHWSFFHQQSSWYSWVSSHCFLVLSSLSLDAHKKGQIIEMFSHQNRKGPHTELTVCLHNPVNSSWEFSVAGDQSICWALARRFSPWITSLVLLRWRYCTQRYHTINVAHHQHFWPTRQVPLIDTITDNPKPVKLYPSMRWWYPLCDTNAISGNTMYVIRKSCLKQTFAWKRFVFGDDPETGRHLWYEAHPHHPKKRRRKHCYKSFCLCAHCKFQVQCLCLLRFVGSFARLCEFDCTNKCAQQHVSATLQKVLLCHRETFDDTRAFLATFPPEVEITAVCWLGEVRQCVLQFVASSTSFSNLHHVIKLSGDNSNQASQLAERWNFTVFLVCSSWNDGKLFR